MKTIFVLLLSLFVFIGCEIEEKGDININMKEKGNPRELSYEEAKTLATGLANKKFESTFKKKGMITSEFWYLGKKEGSRWIFTAPDALSGPFGEVSFNLDGSDPKVEVGFSNQ
jgi:hypothetical protein